MEAFIKELEKRNLIDRLIKGGGQDNNEFDREQASLLLKMQLAIHGDLFEIFMEDSLKQVLDYMEEKTKSQIKNNDELLVSNLLQLLDELEKNN